MADYHIVLASASPRRRELLAQIGIIPQIIPSMKEERITTEVPEQAVMELSKQKAEDVAAGCPEGTLIIRADTVVSAGGQILGKPGSAEEAVHMIGMLQGGRHQVYTGVTLILKCGKNCRSVTFAEKTEVWVYPVSEEEIVDYVSSGEPMDKAGAYGIQGKFAAYIQGIDGDYTNVVGLPVGRVYQEIKKLCKIQEESTHD